MVPKTFKAISCGYAMYNLTVLYFELLRNEELREHFEAVQPEPKFVCIKGIIFLTVFQNFVLNALCQFDFLDNFYIARPPNTQASPEEVRDAILNFLLCIEMLIFAILHLVAYPSQEFDDRKISRAKDFHTSVGWSAMYRDIMELRGLMEQRKQALECLTSGETLAGEDAREVFNSFAGDRATITRKQFRYISEQAGFEE